MRSPFRPWHLLKIAFPFSPRGAIVLAVAAVLFALGILRSDLAGLFWGASFLALPLYAVAAGHLLRLSLRRRATSGRDSLSLELPSAGIPRGEAASARLSVRLPRSFPPGFSVRFLLPLRWRDRRMEGVETTLAPGANEHALALASAHRGAFQSETVILQVTDLFRFTKADVAVRRSSAVTVYPGLAPMDRARRLEEESEQTAPRARSRRRTEELLEARKYYPGDDPRRINWKVYAHMGELFLRIGEETPPPESRILFVLDASLNPLVPALAAADYLDSMVEAFASAIVDLLSQDIDVLACVPGALKCSSFTKESQGALLAALAGVWWTEPGSLLDLPARRSLHVAVYSSPGSPGLQRIIEATRARGFVTSLFLKGLPPEPPAQRTSLSSLLLLPPRPAAGSQVRAQALPSLGQAQRAALGRALSLDLMSYRGPPWMVKYAAEI